MHAALLALLLLPSEGPANTLAASLLVDGNRSTFATKITRDLSAGYAVTIDCVERCTIPVHYREVTGDTLLGLFSRDQNDLIFSLWSGGSAYRVVVWSISNGNVRKVAELSSRGRPDFMSGRNGAAVIQTYEANSGTDELHRVRWTYANGKFVRSNAKGS